MPVWRQHFLNPVACIKNVRGVRCTTNLAHSEVSENDQSFEVTMTATTEVAEDEIDEGTVTQIQVQ